MPVPYAPNSLIRIPMTLLAPLPRPFPDADLLTGTTVDVVRLNADTHGPDLWRAIGSDPSLWAQIPSGPFADDAAFTEYLRDRIQKPDAGIFAIVDKTGERPTAVGVFFLLNIELAHGTLEMGLIYGPALMRSYAGTEAYSLLVGYVLGTLGYRRLEWRCNQGNPASQRAAERYGFTLEGVLRQSRWVKESSWDSYVYAILDREWPAIETRLRGWLSPENFDADGKQRRALSSF